MTKMNIGLYQHNELIKICVLCEREVPRGYYHIDIEFEDDKGSYGRYKNLCPDCHCSLRKHFTGID